MSKSSSTGDTPAAKPFWSTPDGATVKLYHGHVINMLAQLPPRSVQCCVTSPPYWGLRDYGTGTWEGGDEKCDHEPDREWIRKRFFNNSNLTENSGMKSDGEFHGGQLAGARAVWMKDSGGKCPRCGATSTDQQIGSEPSPDCGTQGSAQCGKCFVCSMVAVFRGVKRVLRPDGVLWLNLGDTYCSVGGSRHYGSSDDGVGRRDGEWGRKTHQLPSGSLVGIPWRVALALQADGWVLRQDVIWCLSGGTNVYARTQKGDMISSLKDLYRLKPETVKLWNGSKWTQLLGMSRTKRDATEVVMQLRSGERINCTTTHKFPVKGRGVVPASKIKTGDVIETCTLPEPDQVHQPSHITDDAAWLAGLYLAEGSGATMGKKDRFVLAGHVKETERWERVRKIANDYGGTAVLRVSGNNQTIAVYGKVITALVRQLITGKTSHDKGFAPTVWRHSNKFIESLVDGYLSGDGSDNGFRWRLGFTRNPNLERDLRTACARLDWCLTLNQTTKTIDGKKWYGYRGEIRKVRSGHHNERDRGEVMGIWSSRCRYVYDVGVADDPHLFALASGVLTHNSKPNPMPESVTNRCTKAHEYLFMLTLGSEYYFDAEAIKEDAEFGRREWKPSTGKMSIKGHTHFKGGDATQGHGGTTTGGDPEAGRNKRSVWNVSTFSYPGAHFATFPPKLIEPCILSSTSEKGCCAKCGAPWQRATDSERVSTRPGKDTKVVPNGERLNGMTTGNRDPERHVTSTKTVGWGPGCACRADVVPCVVLDPFVGSGTTACVAIGHGRRAVGIDLSEVYLTRNAIPRIQGTAIKIPSLARVLLPERKAVTPDAYED